MSTYSRIVATRESKSEKPVKKRGLKEVASVLHSLTSILLSLSTLRDLLKK
jgi:hypothetical protein